MNFYNVHRAYQATFLLPALHHAAFADGRQPKWKDHRVLHAHRVLEVLGRMMAPPPNPEMGARRNQQTLTDTCFPSLLTVSRETCLSDSTVRDALGDLIEWGLILKTRMPGHAVHKKGKGSPVFEHCRYHLVPEVWDAVESPFRSGYAGSKATARASVAAPVPSAEDQATADSLDIQAETVAPPARRSAEEQETVTRILAFLRETFPEHPTYLDPNADAIMSATIEGCIVHVGEARRCLNVLRIKLEDETLRLKIGASNRLGGYIRQSFTGWVADYENERRKEMASDMANLCRGGELEPLPPNHTYAADFRALLHQTFGDELISIEDVDAGDDLVTLKPEMTTQAKIAYLLSHATGKEVFPNAVPDFADQSTVEQVCLALDDARWADHIRAAEDPLAYFIDRWSEISVGQEVDGQFDYEP
jgi:hypothetical protein